MTTEIPQPVTDVEALLPGPAARAGGLEYARIVWSGVLTNEQCAIDIRAGLHSLPDATGVVLDQLGDWVSEQRSGGDGAPYRLLVAGRRVAQAGGVTPPAIVRGWRQVTGDPEAVMDEEPMEVLLTANVLQQIDTAWLARAAEITRDTIGNGRVIYATISSPGTFVWGVSTFEIPWAADFS